MAEPFTLYKLIILYMLDRVDFPLTNSQISSFLLDRGYTNYFTLQQAFSELEEANLVKPQTIRNTTQFQLTKSGREALGYFCDRIPNAIQEENLALAYRRGKKRGLKWAIGKDEQVFYKEQLKALDLGLEDRMTSKVGLLSGGQRQALTLLMASLQKPQLLLLDEHTAALDPKTAAKVLQATNNIVNKDHLTTLMITHNMRDAIANGNRLIMLNNGKVILDIEGEEKKRLTVDDLLHQFAQASGEDFANDRTLLS